MQKDGYQHQSVFAKTYLGQGGRKGCKLGSAEVLALAASSARGGRTLPPSSEQRSRIEAERNGGTSMQWLARAVTRSEAQVRFSED
jgi:hypothetical protein